jgi:hypothetical protein
MSAGVLPQSVYRRAKEPRDVPDDLRLRALEWALYFAVTGKHTAAELGRMFRASAEARDEALARLQSLGLITEQELAASEYVRALAAAGEPEETTLREFLMGATQPAPATDENVRRQTLPRTDQPDEGSRTVRIEVPAALAAAPRPRPREVPSPAAPHGRPALAQPAFGFKPLPSPDDVTKENRRMSATRRLSLRALMNVIEGRAASREAGQLDVYRVFVRVDTLLLKRNGIETLRFTEDRLISDPELEQALVRSLKKTLGLDCPESVWVEVA